MKNIYKPRLPIAILIVIIFTHLSLNAATLTLDPVLPIAPESGTPVSPIEHQETIRNYINQLRSMNNRAFQLVQLTLDTPARDLTALRQSINSINSEIYSMRRAMRDYLSYVQTTGVQTRDILLLFNALNHTSNQLYYLEQLSLTTSIVEKVILLEDFFRSKSATTDTLDAIEAFISRQ